MEKREIGSLGEKIAADYLKNKGYRILGKNYSFRIQGNPQKGEIDIVAEKSGIISFVEVKTLSRGRASGFSPEEKVNFEKQRKLVKTAESWLIRNKIPLDVKWQIDIISLELDFKREKANIRHFKNILC